MSLQPGRDRERWSEVLVLPEARPPHLPLELHAIQPEIGLPEQADVQVIAERSGRAHGKVSRKASMRVII
jgi:hypothetical protein